MPEYWVEINRLENEGDVIYRTLLRDLFGGAVTDPVEIIKHKDIIERLEEFSGVGEALAGIAGGGGGHEGVDKLGHPRNPRGRRGDVGI